jgi:uncharacterized protein (DUF433 family)
MGFNHSRGDGRFEWPIRPLSEVPFLPKRGPVVQFPYMDATTTSIWKYLAPNPKSAYKQLFIKGRRIRARDLYGLFMSAEEPMTAEQIAREYDLPLEVVQEAIAYCQTDPPEIKEDFAREERIMEATGMNDPDYKYGGKYRILSPQERARLGI